MNDFLKNIIKSIPETQLNLVQTLGIIAIIWVFRIVLIKIVNRQIQKPKTLYIWRQTIHHTTLILGILLIARLWFSGVQSILTFLGIIAAGLTIAMKEPLQNVFAWMVILWRELFSLGDRIEVGKHAGDVVDMGVFYFTLMEIGNWVDADQSTGRIIKVPNGVVLINAVANYSRGLQYIWNEIPVLLTHESDWKIAKKILMEITERHAVKLDKRARKKLFSERTEEFIIPPKLTPIVYTSVNDSGILLTIRYLCAPRYRRNSEDQIWEDILEIFQNHATIKMLFK